jgi:hypothetical protein
MHVRRGAGGNETAHHPAGTHFQRRVRRHHKVGIGPIATTTALVLGLVTAATKGSFDDLNNQGKHTAADVLSLDRILARYGPETAAMRGALKLATQRIDMTWPRSQSRRGGVVCRDCGRQPVRRDRVRRRQPDRGRLE